MTDFGKLLINKITDQWDNYPSWLNSTLYILLVAVPTLYSISVQIASMDTLLPICFSWMHYNEIVICIFGGSYLLSNTILKKHVYPKKIFECCVDNFLLLFLLIPGMIFIPNRCIPIGEQYTTHGIMVEQSSWYLPKTSKKSRISCVKIKIQGENISFWHNYHTKPIGSRCIIKMRTGLWGMRYVQDVDFIVE